MPSIRKKCREAMNSFQARGVQACQSRGRAACRRHTQQASRISSENNDIVAAPGTPNQGTRYITDGLWRVPCEPHLLELSLGLKRHEPAIRRPECGSPGRDDFSAGQGPGVEGIQCPDPQP